MLSSLGCISQFSLDVLGTLDSIFSTEALAGHLKGRGALRIPTFGWTCLHGRMPWPIGGLLWMRAF